MNPKDTLLQELRRDSSTNRDFALAQHHAPRLRFDAEEPFSPLAVGYTVFRHPAQSLSSKFAIDPEAGLAIEYAIWWDWDIQHLYELEHIWVYMDANETLIKVEASAHGSRLRMGNDDSGLPIEGERITLYSEPGKHGFAPNRNSVLASSQRINLACGADAGNGGIHMANQFDAEAFGHPSAQDMRLATRYLQRLAFSPTYDFSQIFDLRSVPMVTWEQLQAWIPRRIQWWCGELRHIVPHLRLVCLDSGDTLVNEATEVKAGEVALQAELIPGAAEMLQQLQKDGYTLALVADGPRATFENVLKQQYGLWDAFSAFAISEDVGVSKPHARMFLTALNAMEILPSDYRHVVMVGNNLARDIKGANDIGLISVWLNWSPRRSKIPANDSEIPTYTIQTPFELPSLLEAIELNLSESSI